jgi:hypothetical protein
MSTTEHVLRHHFEAFDAGDLDGLMSDYAEDAVLITSAETLVGSAQIRPFFARMVAEFNQPGVAFQIVREEIRGDVAFILWTAETPHHGYPLATDTFVIRNGKIVTQTFVANAVPRDMPRITERIPTIVG